jgi:multidrug transporter EmrE-like cation transporter
MWLLTTILSMLILAAVQIPMRSKGLCVDTYIVYAFGILFGTAWLIPYSVKNAPSFTAYWFISLGILSVLGYLIGVGLFKEAVTVKHYLGIALVLVGGYLLK